MAWQTLDQQYEQQNNRNDRSNYLKDIIAGLSIANNNDPATLAGYGIGRFLSNYVNRGLERRQQEKNQGAYDEWMRGRQGIKGEELLPKLQGTPIVNPNTQPQKYSFDPSQIAAEINQQNASDGRTNYLERASEGSVFSAGGKPFFEMPKGNAQPQAETAPSMQESARSIAAEIAARPTTPRFDMTSDEVYQQAYEIARRNGSTEDQARKFAQQRAGLYQSQRVQSLSDQFLNGGVNPDGTINKQGVATLAQLAQENPQQVNMLGNMYQTPQGATKYAQDIAKMMTNSDLHLRNTLQAQEHQAQLRDWLSSNEYGRKWDMLTRQQQLEMEQKMQYADILVGAAGFTPQEAISYVFGGGGRSGRGTSGGDSGKADDARYKKLKDWIDGYGKENRDPVTGEWLPGKGPDDPEYTKRKKAYDSFTDSQDKSNDFDVEIPTDDPAAFAKALRPMLHAEGVPEHLIDGYIQQAWIGLNQKDFSGYKDIKELINQEK